MNYYSFLRLVILLQRRKKYKSRTILGYKTLAEGFIRMDAVLQKSMDMTVELTATGKNGRSGLTVASLRAERVTSIPVDHDNKNNNSVLLTGKLFYNNFDVTNYCYFRMNFVKDISNTTGKLYRIVIIHQIVVLLFIIRLNSNLIIYVHLI